MTTTAPLEKHSAQLTWRDWTALLLLAMPLFMMATDFTAIFLAMPAIVADLGPSTTQLLWIVHIGELIAAGFVITMGWLTGRIGPRGLLLIAMAVYAIASALAAFAPNSETLLAARVLIGLATAAASPAGIALLRALFSSAQHFGIGFAVVMGAFSVGGALGPPLAGLLLEYSWWGSVFLVNVPVAAIALLGGLWLFPCPSDRTNDRIDMTSVVISISSVILAVYGLQNVADRGISINYALTIIGGVLLGWWFIGRQRRIANPLLDLNLFSFRVLRILAIVFVTSQIAFMAVDFVLVQYLQMVTGIATAPLGLLLAIPATAAIISTALTPALSRRLTPSTVMTAGMSVAVLGTAIVLAALTFAAVTPLFAAGMTVIALGVSPPMVVGAQLMVTSVTQKQAGPAASIQDIAASLGAAVGIVVLGSLSMAVFNRSLRATAPDDISDSSLDIASESPGGAASVSASIGGGTGQELLQAAQAALSWGTIAAYFGALIIGIATIVILRGLRGVEMPADEKQELAMGNASPESTLSTPATITHPQSVAVPTDTTLNTRRETMIASFTPLDAADEAAIRRIVADIEQGFNDNDPKALVRHIASDALIVNPLGMVMRGPEEVENSIRPLLAGPLYDATAHYRLSDLAQLAPGVVVAHKNAWSSREAADLGELPQMNALYVFVERESTWWIARRQNTTISS